MTMKRTDIRNIAIIAHVDHGKTTLVDQMLRQSGLFRESELKGDCILDSNDLERERGITILAKNIAFRLGDTKINLIDTPGHADFGGEVERVLSMADGCFVLVDAAEGPLPQTRFVLRKAFAKGLKPIVVINKIDRGDARPVEVLNEVYDLFIELDADDATLDFPVIYASGRQGIATTDPENAVALPPITVDEPTLDMVFRVNDAPFAGQDGTPITSRQLRDRLERETESNVAMRVRPSEGRGDEFVVSGRGMLHLGILLENMRREGLELAVGKPQVIYKEQGGQKLEPIEYLVVEAPSDAVGPVMQLVLGRRGECVKMDARDSGTHLEFTIPARGLIGLRTRLLNATAGRAIMHHNLHDYQPSRGSIPARLNGVLISTETGRSTAYAIDNLQDRGSLFVGAAEQVYEGQIVGE